MAYIGLSQHIDFCRLPSPDGRFELKHLIGEGTYGEVYAAWDKVANKTVAVKILETIADNLEEIEEEFLVLRDLSRHPNLPEFYGIYLKRGRNKEEDQLWFAMQLCTGGSITDLVHELRLKGSRLTDNTIAYILRETVKALVYLHQNHCMHRDVKGHNILLTEEGNVKLVDFGVCSHLAATLARRNTSVGTPYWMSPEVIACEQQLDQSYDSRCDIWSLGITGIELAEGDPPLSELHPMRALFQIPRNPPPNLVQQENFSPLLSGFISQCLVKDFEQRPFARELLEHQFLRNVDEKKAKRELCMEIERQRASQRGFVRSKIEVTTKYGKLKSDRKSRPTKMYIDDLAALETLSEEIITEQLKSRYEANQIYTYIGDILVACNPFEKLGLYTLHYQQKYSARGRSENPPHIFAVADAALQALVHEKQNQAIVISGESGSGKTESANLLLKQLVFLGKATNRNLEEKILQVNPIMESFGNARTGINSNSSRFGKYLELLMTRNGKVTGARISVYLLEQSRVIRQAENEGNFHIFYYFYDGMEEENRLQEYYLDPSYKCQHKYLRHMTHSIKSNQEKWKQLKTCFKVVGFKESEIDSIHRILAAILNLGDIEFGEVITNDNTDNKATVIDIAPLLRVSKLLGVEKGDLLEALISNSVVTRGETIVKNNTVQEAIATRDAMAKALYGRLFDWMVNNINTLLINDQHVVQHLSVGLLDIFGFESLSKNTFEQLMINIANEQIQYYFNQKIFSWEQQEYISEGIPIDLVEFADNRPILDMLLSRPLGLLALLDEESRFPKSSDETLIEKFHGNIKSKFYQRPKSNALCFAIHHYAGRVVYNADGFLEKNKNFLPPEIIQLIRGSQHDVIRFLFQCPITRTGNLYSALLDMNGSKSESMPKNDTKERCNSRGLASQSRAQQTAATYFRYSLMDLLQKMIAGTPQFVRCIKPNDLKIKKCFEDQKVVKQLRYTGVLETIRIRQNGFSHRLLFSDFLKKYCFLAYGYKERVVATRESCKILLTRLKIDGYALGKSKVFLKYYHIEYLAKLYEEKIKKIVLVQSYARRWLAKSRVKKLRSEKLQSALTLQKHVRGWLTRRKIKLLRQAKELEKKAKDEENAKHAALLKRLELHKPKVENENRAALVIQTCFRNHSLKIKITPDMEEKIKLIVKMADSRFAAHKLLKKEGYKEEDIVRILEKYYKRDERNNQLRSPENCSNNVSPYKKAISVKERQMELVNFAQDIHIRNQEIHKNLRQNKVGVPNNHIERLPPDYKRPPGFSLIPSLLGNYPRNEHYILNLIKANSRQYFSSEKSSLNDFDVDVIPWDYLMHKSDKPKIYSRYDDHKRSNNYKEISSRGSETNSSNSNWYSILASESAHQRMRPMEECLHKFGAFNYLNPSPTQLSMLSKSSEGSKKTLQEFQEEQRKMQIKFINEKNKEKKNKKKSKREMIKEDIIIYPHDKTKESNHSDENHQVMKTHCGIQNGVYINNFDKLNDLKSNLNFSITKELNDDNLNISSSKSSSTSSNRSNMSIERSIIKSGLKNFTDSDSSSNHLGPFNFRLLLKPTDHLPPTESLRKRKLIFTSSPHIPDKNIKF